MGEGKEEGEGGRERERKRERERERGYMRVSLDHFGGITARIDEESDISAEDDVKQRVNCPVRARCFTQFSLYYKQFLKIRRNIKKEEEIVDTEKARGAILPPGVPSMAPQGRKC